MTQGERVKKVRKARQLTLEKFGEQIGLKKNTMSAIETGRNSLTEANVLSICREFGVNEVWLRTGEGDAYTKMPEDDLIKRTTELLGKHDPFFESLVYMYSELSDESRKIFLEKGAALFNDALRRQKEKE